MGGAEARLRARLADALGAPALQERLGVVAEPFLARRADDAAAARLEGATLRGVARVLSTSAEGARLLAARPELLERLAAVGDDGAEALAQRTGELEAGIPDDTSLDLEDLLDALRMLRREETLFAACLDLGDAAPFADVSRLLSVLAEHVVRRALVRAHQSAPAPSGDGAAPSFAVIGMGKIGGRELTYCSDLDLLFLHAGGPEEIVRVSRVGQRLVSYLGTTTRAGVAYAVDMRLRPSGHQGLLVTSFDAFSRYQRENAQLWEHLVLMRARAIAGDVRRASETIESARDWVLRTAEPPWAGVAEMRARVERERGAEHDGRIAIKTGPGGLMDVDFLAAGAMLERGGELRAPALPSNTAMLRAAIAADAPMVDDRCEADAPAERLLGAYEALRRVEARARFASARAIEHLEPGTSGFVATAALVGPAPGDPHELARQIAESRRTIRGAWRRVTEVGSIAAL